MSENLENKPWVELIYSRSNWNEVLNACRTTVGKNAIDKEPNENWRRNILLAEHSPIRKLQVSVRCHNVKSWVATHFARHHEGIEKYIQTQRTDRTGINRDELPQGALVTLEMDLNAQAIINISRKRLCSQASKETKELWEMVLDKIFEEIPELYSVCVPECVYRGFCPELKSCGFCKTPLYKDMLEVYHNMVANGK